MLLDELAKELVEVTSSLVGGRTINIMNTEGIIIASTEHERIGSFHQGALEAVRTGKPVNIQKDQLDRYPGAKEGCNMPLRVNGAIIGVVGIFGNPDEIRDVAHLLEVYSAKYYQMESMLRPRLSESTLRSQLLMRLLSPPNTSISATHSLMETLHIHFHFPIFTAVISSPQGFSLPENAQDLFQRLEQMGMLQKSCDVWGIVEERMVLLCSSDGQRNAGQLQQLTDHGYRVSLGMPCSTLWEIQTSYEQASTLDLAAAEPFNDIGRISTRCNYLLSRTASMEESFLEEMSKKLQENFRQEECRILLQSVKAYYDCGRSVATAAQQQFIHKNTLQYRVRRVLEVLEISKLPAFWQEYLIRLVAEHLNRKSRSIDLEK